MNPDLDVMCEIARAVHEAKTSICTLPGLPQWIFFQQAQHLKDQGLVVAEFQVVQGRVTAAVVRRLTPMGEVFVSAG